MDEWSLGFWVIVSVGFVVFILWLWKRRKSTDHPGNGWSEWKKRVLVWLNAVDQQELAKIQERLEFQRAELAARLDNFEVTLRRQGKLENWVHEVDGRLCRLELSQDPHQQKERSQHGLSKSMLCLGVRVTLTDQIWHELGLVNPDDLPDSQIAKFIQGPFCRNCLRSLVIPYSGENEKCVRTQCRYCGLAWREDSTTSLSLLLIKREMYEYLDQVYRQNRHA